MNINLYTSQVYKDLIKKNKVTEKEILRLIQVKSEKMCNDLLKQKFHTQLSYFTEEQRAGALSVPREVILSKILAFLQKL